MRGILTLFTFVSVIFFPWPFTALLALVSSLIEPLVPLAVGMFADTLYYTPSVGLPFFTLAGAVATTIALLVRSRLRASTIR
jgi:hypothetical protein